MDWNLHRIRRLRGIVLTDPGAVDVFYNIPKMEYYILCHKAADHDMIMDILSVPGVKKVEKASKYLLFVSVNSWNDLVPECLDQVDMVIIKHHRNLEWIDGELISTM